MLAMILSSKTLSCMQTLLRVGKEGGKKVHSAMFWQNNVCSILSISMDSGEVNYASRGVWEIPMDILYFIFSPIFGIHRDCITSWMTWTWLRHKAMMKEQTAKTASMSTVVKIISSPCHSPMWFTASPYNLLESAVWNWTTTQTVYRLYEGLSACKINSCTLRIYDYVHKLYCLEAS